MLPVDFQISRVVRKIKNSAVGDLKEYRIGLHGKLISCNLFYLIIKNLLRGADTYLKRYILPNPFCLWWAIVRQ